MACFVALLVQLLTISVNAASLRHFQSPPVRGNNAWQNAKCKLEKSSSLIWVPQRTWRDTLFPKSLDPLHNTHRRQCVWSTFDVSYPLAIPCQVSNLSVTRLVPPFQVPNQSQLPLVAWITTRMKAYQFYKVGAANRSCADTIQQHAGEKEFDCSYFLDQSAALSNAVYLGHDPEFDEKCYYLMAAYMFGLIIVGNVLLLVCPTVACCGCWMHWRNTQRQKLKQELYEDLQSAVEEAGKQRMLLDSLKSARKGTQPSQQESACRDELGVQVEMALDVATRFAHEARVDWRTGGSDTGYLLASAPEFDLQGAPSLAVVAAVLVKLGGINVAGDARDFLSTVLMPGEMDKARKLWRTAWKGKVTVGVSFFLKKFKKGKINKLVILAIDGGPECVWEQTELKEMIIPGFQSHGASQRSLSGTDVKCSEDSPPEMEIDFCSFPTWKDCIEELWCPSVASFLSEARQKLKRHL